MRDWERKAMKREWKKEEGEKKKERKRKLEGKEISGTLQLCLELDSRTY